MRKVLAGVLIGIVLSALVSIPGYLHVREKWFDLGRNTGRITGLADAARALQKELGDYNGRGEYKVLFSVKTTDVISLEVDGIKTVRVIL